jgi:hypothetical protein
MSSRPPFSSCSITSHEFGLLFMKYPVPTLMDCAPSELCSGIHQPTTQTGMFGFFFIRFYSAWSHTEHLPGMMIYGQGLSRQARTGGVLGPIPESETWGTASEIREEPQVGRGTRNRFTDLEPQKKQCRTRLLVKFEGDDVWPAAMSFHMVLKSTPN